MFRVGRADETLAIGGITHLVEHLAVHRVGRLPFPRNGWVDDGISAFSAEGEPAEVASYLTAIARALTHLPLDRLNDERRVLKTEASGEPGNFVARALGLRYGATGPGLADYFELGLDWLDERAIASWAAGWFVKENAAVWLSGPVPEGLSLDMPRGARAEPPPADPLANLRLPAYAESGGGAVGLSLVIPRSAAMQLTAGVLYERLFERLRTELAIIYDVDGSVDRLGGNLVHLTLRATCLDEHAGRVAEELVGVLEGLAEDGPTLGELEAMRRRSERSLEDPQSIFTKLDTMAENELRGVLSKPEPEVLEEQANVTPELAAQVMAAALETAMLLLPDGAHSPRATFAPYLPEPRPAVDGRILKPRILGGATRAQGAKLAVGDEGVTHRADNADPVVVRFDECAALIRRPGGGARLHAHDNSWISILPTDYVDAEEAIEAINAALPDNRIVPLHGRTAEVDRVAAAKLTRRWIVGDSLDELPEILFEGEALTSLSEGMKGLKAGLVALTDRRLLFVYAGQSDEFLEFPFADIRTVEGGKRFLRDSYLKVNLAGESVRFTGITPSERAEEIRDGLRTLLSPPQDFTYPGGGNGRV